MSFRQFGGLNYSAKNNIITNQFSNSGNLGITDTLGQPNSKIVSQSHIDMSSNSIMHVGKIYFSDGSLQSTAPSNIKILSNQPVYASLYSNFVDYAGTLATPQFAGGAQGSIPYQTTANTTNFLPIGISGTVLSSINGSPAWTYPSSLSITGGTHIATSTTTSNGLSTATISTNATPSSTGSTIVSRDQFGNFSANIGTFSSGIAVSSGSATFSSTLAVSGNATFASGLATNTFASSGAATLSSTLAVSGNATFSSGLAVRSGTATFANGLAVSSGSATLSSTLAVSSNATFSSGLATNTLASSGAATLSSTLAVSGNATFSSGLAVSSGATTLSNTLAVYGGTVFGSGLNVSAGIGTFLGGLAVSSGAATLSSTLAVSGDSYFGTSGMIAANQISVNTSAIAIGYNSGGSLKNGGISIGNNAAPSGQGPTAIAIGNNAAQTYQPNNSIAIGYNAASGGQYAGSIVIGGSAGSGANVGNNSIVIGTNTTFSGVSIPDNNIILNATGNLFKTTTNPSSFYAAPIRNPSTLPTNILYYDSTNSEIVYGAAPSAPTNLVTNNDTNTISANNTFSGTNTFTNGLAVSSGNVTLSGGLAVSGTLGTNGQYLQTTGTGVSWSSIPTTSMNINTSTLASTFYPTFVSGTGTTNTFSTNTALTYTPSTGQLNSTTFNATSDYRIKENVTNLDDSFSVDNLRPVTYFNKSAGKQDIGFIAHEIQEIFPYLVTGEKDGEQMQSLNYLGLIGILTKEIKELKKRVSILENKPAV